MINVGKIQTNQGITLIALIITIIILVILAAISINSIYNMAIVDKAQKGVQQYAQESVKENEMEDQIVGLIDRTLLKIKGIQEGTGITLNKTKLGLQLKDGEITSEKLTVTLLNITGNVEWTSSVPEVATVSNDGTITALLAGDTIVTAKVNFDGQEYSASCEVTVTNTPVTSVTLNATSKTMEVGENFTLTASVLPDTAINKGVTWSTDTPTVATVENGVVTARGAGTAIITATANDGSGYNARCTVTVNLKPTLVSQITDGSMYGYSVTNYNAGNVNDWKVFYNDGSNVYLISDGLITEKITDGGATTAEAGVNYLKNTSNWTKYVDLQVSGAVAYGGPTAQMFVDSYNQKNNTSKTVAEYQIYWDSADGLYYNTNQFFFLATAYSETVGAKESKNKRIEIASLNRKIILGAPEVKNGDATTWVLCVGFYDGMDSLTSLDLQANLGLRALVKLPTTITGTVDTNAKTITLDK